MSSSDTEMNKSYIDNYEMPTTKHHIREEELEELGNVMKDMFSSKLTEVEVK